MSVSPDDNWASLARTASCLFGSAIVALPLSACSGGADRVVERGAASGSPAAPAMPRDHGPAVNSSAEPHAIPIAMVGKWGMTLADCDPSNGDDKGMLIVAPDSLKFFESRAQLVAVVSAGDDRLRAAFAFAGEGRNWTREEELRLQSDGKSLIRREGGGDPPTAWTTYLRCPRSSQERP